MPDELEVQQLFINHKDLEEEVNLLLSILPAHDDITKESLLIAGVYAKLDMILEEVSSLTNRISYIESRLSVDNRVGTWLKKTTTNK